ncbi:MAG: type 1 glutamine amidotransferase [Actinomycetaceae bacterium]|nr:type 1 glutamine amidotransferase [Actinomycetaceae bacterium]
MSTLDTMFRHVNVLQNDPTSTIELVGDWLNELGVSYRIHRLYNDEFPDSIGDGVIVLGGRPSANQDDAYPFLVKERLLLRHLVDDDVPIFGICLGMQLLTLACGGTMDIRSARGVESGPVNITWRASAFTSPVLSSLAHAFPDGCTVSADHADGIETPPEGAQILAESDRYIHAIRVGSALAVQFHPEAGPTRMRVWEKSRGVTPESLVNNWLAQREERIKIGRLLTESFVCQDELACAAEQTRSA